MKTWATMTAEEKYWWLHDLYASARDNARDERPDLKGDALETYVLKTVTPSYVSIIAQDKIEADFGRNADCANAIFKALKTYVDPRHS